MNYRYYSTQRPVGPGTFPQKDGREWIVNFFGGKIQCEEIDREAWGYIEYPSPLTDEEIRDYELTPGGKGGKIIETDDSFAILIKEEK